MQMNPPPSKHFPSSWIFVGGDWVLFHFSINSLSPNWTAVQMSSKCFVHSQIEVSFNHFVCECYKGPTVF